MLHQTRSLAYKWEPSCGVKLYKKEGRKMPFYEPFQGTRALCNSHEMEKLCDGSGLLLHKRKNGGTQWISRYKR